MTAEGNRVSVFFMDVTSHAHPPEDGPTSMHMMVMLSGLRSLNLKVHDVGKGNMGQAWAGFRKVDLVQYFICIYEILKQYKIINVLI